MSRRKKNIAPLGCVIALLYFPFGVIFELAKMPKYQTERKRRRRR